MLDVLIGYSIQSVHRKETIIGRVGKISNGSRRRGDRQPPPYTDL